MATTVVAQPDPFGLRKKTQAIPIIGNVQATNPASAAAVTAGLVTVAAGSLVADRIAERGRASSTRPISTTPTSPTSARRSLADTDPEVARYLRNQPTAPSIARDTYTPTTPSLPTTATATPTQAAPYSPFNRPSDNLTRDEQKSLDAWSEPSSGPRRPSPNWKPLAGAAAAGAATGYLLTHPFDLGGNPPASPGPGPSGTPDGGGPDVDPTGGGGGGGPSDPYAELRGALDGPTVVPETPIQNPADRAISLIFAPLGGLGEGIADIGTGTGFGLGAIGGGAGEALEKTGAGFGDAIRQLTSHPAVPITLAVGGLLLLAAKDPGIRGDLANARKRHRAKKEKSPIKKAPNRHPGVPGA